MGGGHGEKVQRLLQHLGGKNQSQTPVVVVVFYFHVTYNRAPLRPSRSGPGRGPRAGSLLPGVTAALRGFKADKCV